MKLSSFLLAAITAIAAASSSYAAESSASHVDRLVAAKAAVAQAASHTKGIPRAERDIQRARLRNLIDALERGDAVDPATIDRELERAETLAR